MKTLIVECLTYADALSARAAFGDHRISYVVGVDSSGFTYVVASMNIVKYLFIKRRLEKELERGANFEIIETA